MEAFLCRTGITALGLSLVAISSASQIIDYDFVGNATDGSGLNNHGVVHGNPSFSGSTINFNNPSQGSATQWVEIPNSTSVLNLAATSFTFGMLMKVQDTSGQVGRAFGGGWNEPQIAFVYNATGVPHAYWQVRDDMGNSVTTRDALFGNPLANITDGVWRWSFGVLDRNAKQIRQYVNDTKIAEVNFSSLAPIHFPGLNIGSILHQESSAAMLMSVDRFVLFDEALTDQRITDFVNPVPEPTTVVALTGLFVAFVRRRKR